MATKAKHRPSRGSSLSLLALLLILLVPLAHPQGCSQCREAIGQTPARTRQAYRRAITVLVFAGTGVFAAAVLAIRRFR